jgi:ATP-dependent DNA ligase
VAVDPASGKFKPFQTLLTRKKKDEREEDVKVPVRVQAFDLIFLNGQPLLQRPLQERRCVDVEVEVEVEACGGNLARRGAVLCRDVEC